MPFDSIFCLWIDRKDALIDTPTATCLRQQQSQIWSTLTPRRVFCQELGLLLLLSYHQSWSFDILWHWLASVDSGDCQDECQALCAMTSSSVQDVSRWIIRLTRLVLEMGDDSVLQVVITRFPAPSSWRHEWPLAVATCLPRQHGRKINDFLVWNIVELCGTKPCSPMFIHVHYVIGIWAQPSLASWILRGCHNIYNVYWVTTAFPVIPVQGAGSNLLQAQTMQNLQHILAAAKKNKPVTRVRDPAGGVIVELTEENSKLCQPRCVSLSHVGLSENRVYSQWNSHLIGIMIINHWV